MKSSEILNRILQLETEVDFFEKRVAQILSEDVPKEKEMAKAQADYIRFALTEIQKRKDEVKELRKGL